MTDDILYIFTDTELITVSAYSVEILFLKFKQLYLCQKQSKFSLPVRRSWVYCEGDPFLFQKTVGNYFLSNILGNWVTIMNVYFIVWLSAMGKIVKSWSGQRDNEGQLYKGPLKNLR